MSKRTLPPHPATVDPRSARPPHPATVAQRRSALPWAGEAAAPPHAAAKFAPRVGAPFGNAGPVKRDAGPAQKTGQPRSAQRSAPLFAIPFGPRRALLVLDATESVARSIQAMFAPRSAGVLQRSSNDGKEKETEKQRRRRRIVTRVLRVDQHQRPRIGIHSTRRSKRSIRRNIPRELEAKGGGKVRVMRLYSYMRRFGGAGMLGFHRDLGERPRIVRNILEKMVTDRTSRSRRGPKFIVVAIDLDLLDQSRVLDLQDRRVRDSFAERYGGKESISQKNYMGMYQTHAKEGVVVIDGNVSRNAIVAIRAFRGVPTLLELQQILDELVEEEEEDLSIEDNTEHDDFHDKGGGGFDKGGGSGSSGGFGSLGIEAF